MGFVVFLLIFLFLTTHAKTPKLEERYYELLVKSFLGAQDLESAIKVLQEVVQRFPQNPRWWDLYGQALTWNNMEQKAMDAYLEGYRKTGDKNLAKKAFELSLATSRFDVARDLMGVAEAPSGVRAYILNQLGDVDGLLEVLGSMRTRESLLTKAQVEFAIGRIEEAKNTIHEYQRLYGQDEKSILLLANMYYSKREFEEALSVLKAYLPRAKAEEVEFFRVLSDTAWMLQDYKTALVASERLIQLEKAEDSDYERLSDIYLRLDPKRSVYYALEGYTKSESVVLLKKAVFYAFSSGLYQDVIRIFRDHRDILNDDVNMLSSYLISLRQTGRQEESIEELKKLLIDLQEPDLISLYIYFLVEGHKVRDLQKALFDYSQFAKDPKVAIAFSVAYIFLQDGQKSMHYYKLSGSKDPLLLADIKNVLGMEEEAKALRYRTYKELTRGEVDWGDPEKLRIYLSLASEFERPEVFEKKLQRARDLLSDAVWKDIYFSYLFSKEQRDRAYVSRKLYKYSLKPWMWLNIALWQDDRYLILELLENELEALPIRDRVQALKLVGQPKRALEESFKGLEKSPYDHQLYKQMRDLVVEEANTLSFELSSINRTQYGEWRERLSLEIGTGYRGYRVGFNFTGFQPTYVKKDQLAKKVGGYIAELYLRRKSEDKELRLVLGQMERLRKVDNFMLSLQGYLFHGLTASMELGYRRPATESVYLELGGVKDYARLSLNFVPYSRLGFYSLLDHMTFYSQDFKKLGSGFYAYNQVSYRLRFAYPDYTLRVFHVLGNFKEKDGNKGVVQQLSPFANLRALPRDYYSFGIGLSFGYEHKNSYTRVWKPFLDISLGYTFFGRELFLSGELGVGGAVRGRDNLSISLFRSQNVGGLNEGLVQIMLLYRLFF